MSNLMDDPSIITMSSQDGVKKEIPHEFTHLEPGNALSKLLDSAMAAAAKETSPEVNISNDSTLDTTLLKLKRNPKNPDLIYPPETLLTLRHSPLIEDFTPKLPQGDFFRLGNRRPAAKKEWSANYTQERAASGDFKGRKSEKHGKQNKRSSYKEKSERGSTRKDETEFDHDDEQDDKPDWDVESGQQDMGHTVADFENWKAKMKLEERKKNGEVINEAEEISKIQAFSQNAGNDIDSFFSFSKSVAEEGQSSRNQESNRSSRFSSFFKPGGSAPTSAPEPVSHQPPPPQQSQPQQHEQPQPKDNAGFSRIMSILEGGAPQQNQQLPIPAPQQSQHRPPQQQKQQKGNSPPQQERKDPDKDSFFMSLLNKSTDVGGEKPTGGSKTSAFFAQSAPTPVSEPIRSNTTGNTSPEDKLNSVNSQRIPIPEQKTQLQQTQSGPPPQQYRQGPPPPGQLSQGQSGPNGPNGPIPPWVQQQMMQQGLPGPPGHMGQFPPNMGPRFMPPPPNMNLPNQFRQNGIPPQMNQMNPNMPMMPPNFNPYMNMPPPPNYPQGPGQRPQQQQQQQQMYPNQMGRFMNMGPGPVQNSK